MDRIMNECLGGAHLLKWDISDSVNKDRLNKVKYYA